MREKEAFFSLIHLEDRDGTTAREVSSTTEPAPGRERRRYSVYLESGGL